MIEQRKSKSRGVMHKISESKVWLFITGAPDLSKSGWAVAIALLGIFVSVYASRALTFRPDETATFYSAYTVACVILFLIVWGRERCLQLNSEKTKITYQKKQDNLIRILETFPPVHSLESFSLSYKKEIQIKRIYENSDEPPSKEETEESIRRCLSALAILFKQFNHVADSSNYTSNIMIYIPKDIFDEFMPNEERKEILSQLRFVEDSKYPLYRLSGFLHLIKELSCSTKHDNNFLPDEDLIPITLPVASSEHEPTNHRSRYIPVAPLAMKHDVVFIPHTQIFSDPKEFEKWELSPRLRDEIVKYFKDKEQNGIGSILSVRLDYPGADDDNFPIGVLNIHGDRPNLNLTDSKISAYLMMARPMIEHLKELLIGPRIEHDLKDADPVDEKDVDSDTAHQVGKS